MKLPICWKNRGLRLQPACDISGTAIRRTVRDWSRKHVEHRKSMHGLKQMKLLILEPVLSKMKDLLWLNTKQLKSVTGLVMGHYHLKWHPN